MRVPLLVLAPFVSGCFGVYAEVSSTSYPGGSVSPSGGGTALSSGGSSVGFNVGVDFGNVKRRFSMGYEKQSYTVDNGSASIGASSARFDFNILSLSHKAYVRLGGAFGMGSGGSATLAGKSITDASGGGAYGGAIFTYFVNWHLGLHAMVGGAVGYAGLPDASFSGGGVTFRLAATYQFSDVRPDVKRIEPLSDSTDITGMLETGAKKLGCQTQQMTRSTYAVLEATCDGRDLQFFQIAEGIQVTCAHSFEAECDQRIRAIIDAAKGPAPTATPPAQPAAAPVPAPEPAPAPAPTPTTEPTPPASAPTDAAPTTP